MTRPWHRLLGVIGVAMSVVMPGCGDASGPAVYNLFVSPQAPVLAAPQTVQLTADPRDQNNAPVPGITVSWSADDTSIATVSAAGLVTGLSGGSTTIHARAAGVEGHTSVAVVVKATTVTVTPSVDTLLTYRTRQLTATAVGFHGLAATNTVASWTAAPDSVASVDAQGVVQTKGPGNATIIATIDGVSSSASIHVLPPGVDSIAVYGSATVVPLRGHAQFTALLYDERGHQIFRPIIWNSSNPASLPLDSAGYPRGAAAGSGTITASSGGKVSRALPLSVLIMAPLVSLSVGDVVACAATASGQGYCWGANNFGELGDGTSADRFGPVAITGGLTWAQLAAGTFHACGLTTTGQAYCWGDNGAGQLGDGTTTERHVPTPVAGGLTFRAISAGHNYTCAVTTGNAAWCWGGNEAGQLGSGNHTPSLVPAAVQGGLTYQSISTSRVNLANATVTCGVSAAGPGYCWGTNADGQLGTGDSAGSSVPRLVTGGHNWTVIAASTFHSCGVADTGVGYCWGANPYGGFGNGSLASDPRPTAISGGLYGAVSAGYLFGCGVQSGGTLVCFGTNDGAQLGAAFPVQQPAPITPAPTLSFTAVGAGRSGACALTTAGVVYCWGGGTIGIEDVLQARTPQKIFGQP